MHYICDLCGNNTYTSLFEIRSKLIVICLKCGLISYHPLPTIEDLTSLYNDNEYFEAEYFKVDDRRLNTVHYQFFAAVANMAQKECRAGDKILEIGPGKGNFTELCLRRGLNIECLEFSEDAAKKLANKFECKIYHGDMAFQQFEPHSFQMIVAFDVIEHVLSPRNWLHQIFDLLNPQGCFIFSTVNVDNILDKVGKFLYRCGMHASIVKLYPVYHLYYFTPQTLTMYLQNTGFHIETLAQENYDYRKASPRFAEQMVLRGLYFLHNATGRKTNLYGIAKKPSSISQNDV